MEPKFLTEAMNEHELWYAEAHAMKSPDQLAKFISRIMTAYSHDMNTVVHAMNAGALAAISVMNSFPEGGITQSQAHRLLGLFVRKYAKMQGPVTLVQWLGLLNINNHNSFGVIPKNVWAEIRKEAVTLLAQNEAAKEADTSKMTVQEKHGHEKGLLSEQQVAHLLSVRDGKVPWGLRVEQ
jgi:hypothetical protein